MQNHESEPEQWEFITRDGDKDVLTRKKDGDYELVQETETPAEHEGYWAVRSLRTIDKNSGKVKETKSQTENFTL